MATVTTHALSHPRVASEADLHALLETKNKVLAHDDAEGTVEILAGVTNIVDHVGDVVEPGAYARTLKERNPKGCKSHDHKTPLAKTIKAEEYLPGDPRLPKKYHELGAGALYVKLQYNMEVPASADEYRMVKFMGEDGEWSIGYDCSGKKGKAVKNPKTGYRHIKDLTLYEVSSVLAGAAPHTGTLNVKSMSGQPLDWAFFDASLVTETKGLTEALFLDDDGEVKSRYYDEEPEEDDDDDDDDEEEAPPKKGKKDEFFGEEKARTRRALTRAAGRYNPNAIDADNDRIVQEGTAFARPGGVRRPVMQPLSHDPAKRERVNKVAQASPEERLRMRRESIDLLHETLADRRRGSAGDDKPAKRSVADRINNPTDDEREEGRRLNREQDYEDDDRYESAGDDEANDPQRADRLIARSGQVLEGAARDPAAFRGGPADASGDPINLTDAQLQRAIDAESQGVGTRRLQDLMDELENRQGDQASLTGESAEDRLEMRRSVHRANQADSPTSPGHFMSAGGDEASVPTRHLPAFEDEPGPIIGGGPFTPNRDIAGMTDAEIDAEADRLRAMHSPLGSAEDERYRSLLDEMQDRANGGTSGTLLRFDSAGDDEPIDPRDDWRAPGFVPFDRRGTLPDATNDELLKMGKDAIKAGDSEALRKAREELYQRTRLEIDPYDPNRWEKDSFRERAYEFHERLWDAMDRAGVKAMPVLSAEEVMAAAHDAVDAYLAAEFADEGVVGWVEDVYEDRLAMGVASYGPDGTPTVELWDVDLEWDNGVPVLGEPELVPIGHIGTEKGDEIDCLSATEIVTGALAFKTALRRRRSLAYVEGDGNIQAKERYRLGADFEVKDVYSALPHGEIPHGFSPIERMKKRRRRNQRNMGIDVVGAEVMKAAAGVMGEVQAAVTEDMEQKVGRVLSAANLARIDAALGTLHEMLETAKIQAREDEGDDVADIAEDAEAFKAMLDGEAIEEFKNLEGKRFGRRKKPGGAVRKLLDAAIDADNDLIVHEGTPQERRISPKEKAELAPKAGPPTPDRETRLKTGARLTAQEAIELRAEGRGEELDANRKARGEDVASDAAKSASADRKRAMMAEAGKAATERPGPPQAPSAISTAAMPRAMVEAIQSGDKPAYMALTTEMMSRMVNNDPEARNEAEDAVASMRLMARGNEAIAKRLTEWGPPAGGEKALLTPADCEVKADDYLLADFLELSAEAKREFSREEREKAADEGYALPDGSYPIKNRSDLVNAIQAYGRAKDHAACKRHIIKRARALGAMSALPEGWA
jgi:hypothetical protein